MRRGAPTVRRLALFTSFVVIGHLVLVSRLEPWWAGAGVGPRLMTDVAPYLVFLAGVGLADVVSRWSAPRAVTAAVIVLACAAVAFSVVVNARAATHRSVLAWHFEPRIVDSDPDRLWDWSDPPFLR